MVADPVKFPSGMLALAEYVHRKGMKLGIYSSASNISCAKFMGSEGHEARDAATFTKWKIDYLKFDACQSDQVQVGASTMAMGAALKVTNQH